MQIITEAVSKIEGLIEAAIPNFKDLQRMGPMTINGKNLPGLKKKKKEIKPVGQLITRKDK